MQRSLSGSLALTKLKHVISTMNGKNGPVKGIFIPIEANHLVPGKDNAFYMPIRVIVKDEADQYKQHGFISQSVDSKVFKEASEQQKEEFKTLPILGNLKDFERTQNDAEGAMTEFQDAPIMPDGQNDDLPF
jgi:hypothetical protein